MYSSLSKSSLNTSFQLFNIPFWPLQKHNFPLYQMLKNALFGGGLEPFLGNVQKGYTVRPYYDLSFQRLICLEHFVAMVLTRCFMITCIHIRNVTNPKINQPVQFICLLYYENWCSKKHVYYFKFWNRNIGRVAYKIIGE